jgi:alginate O-acetyltransferase complex protein AlgI
MDFVSIPFFACLALFVIISGIQSVKYTPYLLVAFGLIFIFTVVPLAGGILISEALLCFYITKHHLRLSWFYALLTVIVIFGTFLIFKFLASGSSVIFPLGISYFSFRLIHYVQEGYRQRLRHHSFMEFLAYVTFFPTYLIGPINLFPDFLHDLRRRSFDRNRFSSGLERVVYGYAQLIILGNYLVNHLFQGWIMTRFGESSEMIRLIVHSIHLWMDLYIRFSGYSSIAIGISAMAGFTVPENFNFPFLATNIREFWQRWHMSLTNWCREYIFIPVAAMTRKPFLAICATMITIGIWHELSLRYILWGVYHATGIIIYENFSIITKGIVLRSKGLLALRKTLGIVVTMIFVMASFPVTTLIYQFLTKLLR